MRGPARQGRCGSRRARRPAGRGRRGRTWVSEPGNLFATLLLTDPAPPERAAAAVLRGGARGRMTRSSRLAPALAAAARIQMAERRAARRRQARRHPDRGGGNAAADGRGRHRRQLPASPGGDRLSGDRSGGGRRRRRRPRSCSRRCRAPWCVRLREWGAGFASIRTAWLRAGRRARRRHAAGPARRARLHRPVRDARRSRPPGAAAGRTGTLETIAAGEVFPVAPRRDGRGTLAAWPPHPTNSSSRRSAASARSA